MISLLPTLRDLSRALVIGAVIAAIVGAGAWRCAVKKAPRAPTPDYLFNDSHFHLTNYVQRGTDIHRYLEIMGDKVGRWTLFRIPLQQQWSYANSGDFAPSYYPQSDSPLYYYSFTDAYIARVYQVLSKVQHARLDPMITGFKPTDLYAPDHIRGVLELFPGVFSGIGEFSIHKKFVSSKVVGETASLTNPALDRILDFAGEVGLAVIMHNDIDMPFAKAGTEPIYLRQTKDVLRRYPNTTSSGCTWVSGAWSIPCRGRRPRKPPNAVPLTARSSTIWRTTPPSATCTMTSRGTRSRNTPSPARRPSDAPRRSSTAIRTASCFGTDNAAPSDQATRPRAYHLWDPVWALLTPEARLKIRKANYERIFDAARVKVRAWEKANVKPL